MWTYNKCLYLTCMYLWYKHITYYIHINNIRTYILIFVSAYRLSQTHLTILFFLLLFIIHWRFYRFKINGARINISLFVVVVFCRSCRSAVVEIKRFSSQSVLIRCTCLCMLLWNCGHRVAYLPYDSCEQYSIRFFVSDWRTREEECQL